MRVFVFEFVTGGGLIGQPMIASLAEEGDLMLRALVGDLARIPGVEVVISREARLGDPDLPARVHYVKEPSDVSRCWDLCLGEVDCVWPVAPESGGILERLCHGVVEAGLLLLNSGPGAVGLAASKRATISRLAACGLPVVPTWSADDLPSPGPDCWVLKPDDGAGCKETRLFRDTASLEAVLGDLGPEASRWLVQPFVPGASASLSLLVRDVEASLLGCNLQQVALVDDRFEFLGCVVNGLECVRGDYEALGQGVARAIPGLAGYVGVDLLVTREGPLILEVNPRLTTSYAGLSRSLGSNVAELVLNAARDHEAPLRAVTPGRQIKLELGACHA